MTIDIPARVQLLAQQPLFDLREEWRRLHRSPPPMRLSRDLLIRGIAYKMQERAIGGPSKALLRKLGASNADGDDESDRVALAARAPPPRSLKQGARLVREWRGVTYSVLVVAGGFEWRGKVYPSLSLLAREITGAHWSGPRFFGLKERPSTKNDRAESGVSAASGLRHARSARVKIPATPAPATEPGDDAP